MSVSKIQEGLAYESVHLKAERNRPTLLLKEVTKIGHSN